LGPREPIEMFYVYLPFIIDFTSCLQANMGFKQNVGLLEQICALMIVSNKKTIKFASSTVSICHLWKHNVVDAGLKWLNASRSWPTLKTGKECCLMALVASMTNIILQCVHISPSKTLCTIQIVWKNSRRSAISNQEVPPQLTAPACAAAGQHPCTWPSLLQVHFCGVCMLLFTEEVPVGLGRCSNPSG